MVEVNGNSSIARVYLSPVAGSSGEMSYEVILAFDTGDKLKLGPLPHSDADKVADQINDALQRIELSAINRFEADLHAYADTLKDGVIA